MNPSGQERISLYVGSMEGGKGHEWRRDAVINGWGEWASVSAWRLEPRKWLKENVLITNTTVMFFNLGCFWRFGVPRFGCILQKAEMIKYGILKFQVNTNQYNFKKI